MSDLDFYMNFKPFVTMGIPITERDFRDKDGKQATSIKRYNGRYTMELENGNRRFGLPFGKEGRLVPIAIATLARVQNNPCVAIDRRLPLLRLFDLPGRGIEYDRFNEQLQRWYRTTVYYGRVTKERIRNGKTEQFIELNAERLFKGMAGWARSDESIEVATVTLTDSVWEHLKAHPIPVPLKMLRDIQDNPGALDLMMWIAYRCHQLELSGEPRIHIPFYSKPGTPGLDSQLGWRVLGKTDREYSLFKGKISRWNDKVKKVWPRDKRYPVTIEDSSLELRPITLVSPNSFEEDVGF